MKLDDQELATLWIASFRYYCGRMTLATHSFCGSLVRHWDSIPLHAKAIILEDLREDVQRDSESRARGDGHHPLGMDMDRAAWLDVLRHIEGESK